MEITVKKLFVVLRGKKSEISVGIVVGFILRENIEVLSLFINY